MKTLLITTLTVLISTLGGCGEDNTDSDSTHPPIHVGDDHDETEHHKDQLHDHAEEGRAEHDGDDHTGHDHH